MNANKKKVVAVLDDLMFTVKIQEAVKRAGMEVVFVKTEQDVLARAKEDPAIIILDLNTTAVKPIDLIGVLKNDASTKRVNLLGYVSHVQADLKLLAQETGCDVVLARSAFSQNLPQILKRYSGLQ